MKVVKDSLGRVELVGAADDDLIMPSFSRPLPTTQIPVNIKIDRETDKYGDYWVVFVSRVSAKPGEFVTFGSRDPKVAQDLAQDYIGRKGLRTKSVVMTNDAKAKLGRPKLITNI